MPPYPAEELVSRAKEQKKKQQNKQSKVIPNAHSSSESEERESELRPSSPAHCSYLDIYISKNIRLCKGNFEGQFQTSIQVRIMNSFIGKFITITLIFLLFLAGVAKLHFFPSNCNSNIVTHWNRQLCAKSNGFDKSCK